MRTLLFVMLFQVQAFFLHFNVVARFWFYTRGSPQLTQLDFEIESRSVVMVEAKAASVRPMSDYRIIDFE